MLGNLRDFTCNGNLRSIYRKEEIRSYSLSFLNTRTKNNLRLCENHIDGKTQIFILEGTQGHGILAFSTCVKKAFDYLLESIPHPKPFIDQGTLCIPPPPRQQYNQFQSISKVLLAFEIPATVIHKPIEIPQPTTPAPPPTFHTSIDKPPPENQTVGTLHSSFHTLSASAPCFIPKATPHILPQPPFFNGFSNSDIEDDNSHWNVCYISDPETNPLSEKTKVISEESDEEWVTDRGTDEEDVWHNNKEATKKRNQKKFDKLCQQFKEKPHPRRSKRLSDLRAQQTYEKSNLY